MHNNYYYYSACNINHAMYPSKEALHLLLSGINYYVVTAAALPIVDVHCASILIRCSDSYV